MNLNVFDISFIIPTYNRANVVGNAIESVIKQSNPHWELIIIDDGSTDETSNVVKKYREDKRIKYFYQENTGVSGARNAGAKISCGKYLIFLDSDDILFPDLINKLYQNNLHEYDLVYWQVIRETNGKISIKKPVDLGKMFNNLQAVFLAGSICYRKQIFCNVGGYDPSMTFGENYELGLRIAQVKNLKVKYIEEPFLKYSIDTENRTSNSFKNRLDSHLYQYEKHKEKYKRDPESLAVLYYLIAFIFEKTNKKSAALKYYRNSWLCTPWNLKPALKILYINVFK